MRGSPVRVALCAWALLAGCGPGDGSPRPESPPAGIDDGARVGLAVWDPPAGRGPALASLVRQRFGPQHEAEAWALDAPGAEVAEAGGRAVLRLGPASAEQRLALSLLGVFDPAEFCRVEVDAALLGRGALRLRVWRGPELLSEGAEVELPESSELDTVQLDLPPGLMDLAPFDRLELECSGDRRRLDLAEVRLVELGLAGRLASAGASAELLGEARPSRALRTGEPLLGSLRVRSAERLVVPVAVPPLVRSHERPGALRVEFQRRGAWELVGERALDEVSAGWHEFAFELSGEGSAPTSPGSTALRLTLRGTADGTAQGCLVGPVQAWRPAVPAPCVLLITASDHRADHLALAFRGIDIDTPNLDALARRGVLFEDALASSNGERPALTAVLTGRSPRDTRVLDPTDRLADAALTVAEVFAARGWATAASLGARDVGPASGLGQGFERLRLPAGATRPAAEVVTDALALLHGLADRPTFLWVHLADGRWPYPQDSEWMSSYYDARDDPRFERKKRPRVPARVLPRDLREVRDLDWPRAQLKASLSAMDAALAPLLGNARVAQGWVAYSGVTGVLLGAHGLWFKHRGLYPGVLDVPLLLAGPGVPVGQRDERPVSTLSLGRTMLDLTGEGGAGFPGTSLLVEPDRGASPERFAVGLGAQAVALDDGRHLLVLTLADSAEPVGLEARGRGQRELYELADDPMAEQDRLEEPSVQQELRELSGRLVSWLEAAEDLGWSLDGTPGPEELERLRDLGYTSIPEPAPAQPWGVSRDEPPGR